MRSCTLAELEAAARAARLERFRRGEPEPGKARTRPRSPEKIELLYKRFKDRLKRYPPYKDADGFWVFPHLTA
ncbi:hypothetical protein dsat_2870 [Alkalidesulfovibrio alkalitolerans DSM 16529]|jgi:hypothetical protein|uniref:Uncharacterized protein n=1 Tax=Alkalidesulfovibrio alkalitolerans DSM 16529 TaxID=1121439 RepID=S7TC82_9BACT|nr:hypothetical protein [Alkalidesulfovibrio alkalitolerans]EPR34231.1 hypothetical protein dsat_2870 [Alkalidesulfovibrio alkalitolerans DSM 16529]